MIQTQQIADGTKPTIRKPSKLAGDGDRVSPRRRWDAVGAGRVTAEIPDQPHLFYWSAGLEPDQNVAFR